MISISMAATMGLSIKRKRKVAGIPFNKAHIIGRELYYIAQAVSRGELKGDGPFTHRCNKWFEETLGVTKALLTHSCTGALEMAAILLDLKEGDEVIMPSFTFTSTANAFLLRGAKPIFVDVREDTLNMDERKIEALITDRTKAICPVHYAGVGCEMAEILEVAEGRAQSVVDYLVSQGIDPARFIVESVLPPEDRRGTDDPNLQAQDRYVELTLVTAGR